MKKVSLLLLSALMVFLLGCQKDSLVNPALTEDQPAEVADRARLTYFPDVIPLPTGFQVEGIEIGEGATFYASSLADGSIFKGDLKTGQGAVFNTPPGGQAVGMSYSERSGLLFVAAAGEYQAYVYDGETGDLVAAYDLVSQAADVAGPFGTLVNDVIVTQSAAFFTDSYNPFLYKLPLDRSGQPPASDEAIEIIPMNGFDYTADPNFFFIEANGIVATDPLGLRLIVNNMATGLFYLVDTQTGDATPIDIPGVDPTVFTWGDGLLLSGHTLYVCQNFPNKIAVIELSDDFTSGTWVKDITQDNFNEPATIARYNNYLYAVNAHFFEFYILGMDPSTLPYEVVKVRLF